MKSAVETLEPTRVKVTVEVPYEEIKAQVDAAYREVAQQVNIPGFRRGKVPARIIDQRVGRGVVIEQAVNEALPELYREAMVSNDLRPMGQPDISVSELPAMTGPLGGQLAFTVEVDVRPEIALPKLSGLAIEVDAAEVSDEDVEERLTSLRERFGSLKGVDRAIEDDDFVVVDLVATVDGEEVESVSGVSYQVGSKKMIEGLDEALLGVSAGESKTFTTTLVAGEHADKESEVTVTVTEVKERELPEADDDFAMTASEFDTLEELREDLKGAVARDQRINQAEQARNLLLEQLRESVDFPLPAGIVEAEIAAHLEREGKEADDPHGEEIREDTERMIRDQLLLDVLSETYDVQVEQDELLQFLFSAAQQYGIDPGQFIQAADQNGQIPAFVGEVSRNKAISRALRYVSVKDSAGADVDLSDYIGTDTDEEAEAAKKVEEAAAAPKKPAAKKPAAKKAAAKKADEADEKAETKAPAKKSAAKKPAAKKADEADEKAETKAPAKKPAAKKPAAKKPAAKKADEA